MKPMQAIALTFALLAAGPDSAQAFADLARHPHEDQPYLVYFTTSTVAPEHREAVVNSLRFVTASLSSKSYLPDQLPQHVGGTNLYRLDLRGAGWEKQWSTVIAREYVPDYRPDLLKCAKCGQSHVPLVIRADWAIAELTDPELTGDAQELLLYGRDLKNAAEFQAFWQVNGKSDLAFAMIEGKSGVANQGTRVLRNKPAANRTYYWETFDSRLIAGETDPLENITALPPKHDASEYIAGSPKHAGQDFGALQAYFLSDGNGNAQNKAPADIVVDHSQMRGVEIRNFISCQGCHPDGLALPTLDTYRQYILSGARLFIKDKATQQEVDRLLNSPVVKEIKENNEDYATAVRMCNGLTTKQNAAAYKLCIQLYDQDVTPDQAAREVYASPEEWRLALGDYSRRYTLTGRLALMAQGQAISRDQWKENFHLAQKVIQSWHAQQH